MTGFVGTCLLFVIVLLTEIRDFPSNIWELVSLLVLTGFSLCLATIAGTFVSAFYIALFGFPVAWILGNRIRHPVAIGAALLSAFVGTAFAFWVLGGAWWTDGDGQEQGIWSNGLLPILCFAIPAGLIYRNFVIKALDESEFD